MKIRPQYFHYENLPCIHCKDKLMAASGMYMDPGPRIPGMKHIMEALTREVPRELQSQMPQLSYDPGAIISPAQLPPIDTSKAIPSPIQQETTPPQQERGFNWGNAALIGLSAFDALLPNRAPKQTVVQPQMAYNPNPYGLGSQALKNGGSLPLADYGYVMGEDEGNTPSAKNGNWIQKAINPAHKGYCTPMTKSTCTPRRKALAKTLKKMAKNRKKEEGGFIAPGWDQYNYGGIIPDNMSVFNPHEYKLGGNVNGGAKIREVGPNYPNSDLLEQWLLYANGGNVNGGAKIREVSGKFPNTDLLEQWLLYENGGTLSAAKAKEMLKDGKANGKKLTKKQKQYFGMVAAGKAQAGMAMGDPDPIVSPLQAPKQFRGQANLSGTNVQTSNQFAMDYPDKRMAYGIDLINNIITSGLLPNQTQHDRTLRETLDPQMYTYLYEFNQRPDLQGLSPEQRINKFHTLQSNNPAIQAMKGNIKRYGYGPQEFRRTQALGQFQSAPTAKMRAGGVLYEDGGEIGTMWGGTAELESYNPYDGGTVEFNGPSHDRGGIGMHYNGSPIEVEGGEYASRDMEGNLNIYGNMFIPGTKTKFKKAAGAIADKEKRYDFLKTKGADLVTDSNPANRFDQLSFNSGRVMMQGGQMGMQDLASKKERLANLQRSMLDMAAEQGLDPFEMSKGKMKKAKGGASIPFMENGGGNDPTRADRNMNPGNIKYGKFAQKYGAKKDKDGFAIFPNREVGFQAMRDLLNSPAYKDMSVSAAIKKWTGGQPYRYDLANIRDRKVSDLNAGEMDELMGTMTRGEGTRYGMTPRPVPPPRNTPTPGTPTPFTPYRVPEVPLTPPPGTTPTRPITPYDYLDVPERGPIPSNVEPLGLNNVLGEVYAAATNKVEPVPAQRYEPQLFVPYQVSFQDRLNANQSVFNAQSRAVGAANPAALGTLGAQKYAADQAVLADEFRANQAIANDITNKNISLVNDANLKNLGIADTQMVRQSQARSKTRELNQMIVNSLSSKYAQNELENKKLAAYENLYDYRFVPQEDGGLSATYFGPNAMFNYQGRSTPKDQSVRTISRYDAQGNLKGWAEYEDSELKEQQRLLDMEMKRRKMPLMPLQPLNK